MKASCVYSLTPVAGIRASIVRVEAAVRRGLPSFQISGGRYGTRSVADRLRTAINAAGFSFPYAVVSVHLAPADLAKSGSQLDLAVAAALLKAIEGAPADSLLCSLPPQTTAFLGELSLLGRVHGGQRLAPLLLEAVRHGMTDVVIAAEQTESIFVPAGLRVHAVDRLVDLFGDGRKHLTESRSFVPSRITSSDAALPLPANLARALAVSAAGRHNILLIGPPGTGKTTAARILPSLLPAPDVREMQEITAYAHMNIDGPRSNKITRPVRAPHHLTTAVGLVGGGNPPVPGEVTRAHCGVLILDELGEFSMAALQALREPMEDFVVRIARPAGAVELPAQFLLAGTTNACPCGFHKSDTRQCTCPKVAVRGYLNRILGPLRDRIDIEVSTTDTSAQRATLLSWSSRIEAAQRAASARPPGHVIQIGSSQQDTLESIVRERAGAFRYRASLLRVARTLADLRGADTIASIDLEEAAALRILDDYVVD